MKYWLFTAVVALALVGCGSAHHHHDDSGDHHDDDVARIEDVEDENVYRPSDNGNGSAKEESETDEPKEEADPVVERPKEEPKAEDPVVNEPEPPTEEPEETAPVVEEPTEDDPVVEEPVETPAEEPKDNSPTKHEQLADEFIAAVKELTYDLEETKLWKDYVKSFEKYEKRLDRAVEKKKDDNGKGKDLEEAWADTIEAWYEARYMQLLFLHLNSPAKDFVPIFLHDKNEVLGLTDDELASADCRLNQAASELVAAETQGLGKFQTDVLKYDLVAAGVLDDKKWQKRFNDEKEKWQNAVDGEFDAKDLKKYRK